MTIGRCLLGTNSPTATLKLSWMHSPRPYTTLAMMRALTFCAVAPTIAPINATQFPPIKNHRRPNKSLNRPTIKNTQLSASNLPMFTQTMFLLGPMSALIYVRMLVGKRRKIPADISPRQKPWPV